MALDNCKECAKKVSTTAETCPNCGVYEPVKSSSDKKSPVIGILMMIAFWGFIAFMVYNTNSCSSGQLF